MIPNDVEKVIMPLTKLSYKSLTLEDIEMYQYYNFICDGDKEEIICVLKED